MRFQDPTQAPAALITMTVIKTLSTNAPEIRKTAAGAQRNSGRIDTKRSAERFHARSLRL